MLPTKSPSSAPANPLSPSQNSPSLHAINEEPPQSPVPPVPPVSSVSSVPPVPSVPSVPSVPPMSPLPPRNTRGFNVAIRKCQSYPSGDVEEDREQSGLELDYGPSQTRLDAAKRVWGKLREKLDASDRKLYFSGASEEVKQRSAKIRKLLLQSAAPGMLRSYFEEDRALMESRKRPFTSTDLVGISEELVQAERKVRTACLLYKQMFPSEIWHCCKSSCFASIMINPFHLESTGELRKIHMRAKLIREEIEKVGDLVTLRRAGVGGSTIAFSAPSRAERERRSNRRGTDRQCKTAEFADFVEAHLPFLYGRTAAQNGSKALPRKLCTEAICLLLSISRCFLYHRKRKDFILGSPIDPILGSLIDTSCLRQRQLRRVGSRQGFPDIDELTTLDCGCSEPCFPGVPKWRLEALFKTFAEISKQLKPRRKEHQYLLNIMFCPLSNTTVRQCTRSLSRLYTVSESTIGSIRQVLDRICSDQSLSDLPFRDGWDNAGYTYRRHPLLKYNAEFRSRIENHLDMVLRYDPAGGEGVNVCRVYSLEVNTHQKLRSLVLSMLKGESRSMSCTDPESLGEGATQAHGSDTCSVDCDEEADPESKISQSTLQRVINQYLDSRNLRIVFQQTDHNACPTCKTMQYSVTQYHYEYKQLKMKYDAFNQSILSNAQNGLTSASPELLDLERKMKEKKEHELLVLESIKKHTERDRDIRKFIKVITDYFRDVENDCIKQRGFKVSCPTWNQHPGHGIITHQDDMTKVDLPYFVQSASADITRWRFDVNAHVNAVNGDATVFSHEQGSGSKNASCIIEEIIIDHILRSRGEVIKVIVSDNASVGKNWLSTVALPQYLVDQGLAEIVLIVFLENNHGKWLADMLFGQLQTRRKRTTLLSVDDLLKEFESINRTCGRVRGFALNPLSSVDFNEVFASLGYETKPPKDILFTRRNIHFAAACCPGAKLRLEKDLLSILGPALPEEPGMVRICTNPPIATRQEDLVYHNRYLDVPTCSLRSPSQIRARHSSESQTAEQETIANGQTQEVAPFAPLVVPLNADYAPKGNGFVSSKTADHVGYNGYSFRNLPAFPELYNVSSDLVRRAWPPELLDRKSMGNGQVRSIPEIESRKCAPENWVVRQPVYHMDCPQSGPRARYPPRNLQNALYENGPREEGTWIPTATYLEPPFPIIEGTASFEAMKTLSLRFRDNKKSFHMLQVLRIVYEGMGRNGTDCDEWFQKRATVPSERAKQEYKRNLQTFIERERNYPAPPITLKQSFRKDRDVCAKAEQLLAEKGVSNVSAKMRTKVFNELFDNAKLTPGALNSHRYAVQQDLERVAREMADYEESRRNFDKEKGLLSNSREVVRNT